MAPLVYSCATILPIAYIVGLVYTMKTHSFEVYDEFETQLKEENRIRSGMEHDDACMRVCVCVCVHMFVLVWA